jgi:hypothetical protein
MVSGKMEISCCYLLFGVVEEDVRREVLKLLFLLFGEI